MNKHSSDYRKVNKIISALTDLKVQIQPEASEGGPKDAYDINKATLQRMMDDLREDIATLRELTNDRDIIEQKVILRKRFGDTMAQIKKFGEVLQAMAKENKNPKEIKTRDRKVKQGHQWLELVNEELMRLAEDVREVDVSDLGIDRDAERNRRLEKQKNKRKARRDKRRGTADDDFGEGIYMEDMGVQSEKEQAFIQRVEQSRREEEEMLELISEGVAELHELAITLNKLLKQSHSLLEDIDDKMDRVQTDLDNANKKMTKILDQSGGISRWCPICICVILILCCFFFMSMKFA